MRLRRSLKYGLKWAFVLCSGGLVISYMMLFMDDNVGSRSDTGIALVPDGIKMGVLTKWIPTPPVTTATSTGEALAQRIMTKCEGRSLKQTKFKFPVSSNKKHNLLFCPICKLGSTYWTRFFKFLEKSDEANIISPYDIPIAHAPPTAERMTFFNGKELSGYLGYYGYMFVRDPYSRILSAYIDKLYAPNPAFWTSFGKRIVKRYRQAGLSRSPCGSDLKFSEYVKAIINAHKSTSKSVDCHDATFFSYCHPCEVKYSFVGKMESFVEDSNFIYNRVGLNKTIEYLKDNGGSLADEDALMDTVSSPFTWKSQIKRCIPWREALKRVWRKLQIRGVIGKQDFPLDNTQSESISRDEFIQIIKDTQKLTSYSQRKRQRTEAMIEIFSEVSKADMEALSRVYSDDFDLFEYESQPLYLFNISASFQKYEYLNVD